MDRLIKIDLHKTNKADQVKNKGTTTTGTRIEVEAEEVVTATTEAGAEDDHTKDETRPESLATGVIKLATSLLNVQTLNLSYKRLKRMITLRHRRLTS